LILSDEVYEQILFDGNKHFTVLQHEELRPRSFALYSFGKVYNNTGWKTGYCIAPPDLTKAFRHVHQFAAFCVNTPAQVALAQHLASGLAQPVGPLMEHKRNYFLSLLAGTKFTVQQPASGSYFQVASYEHISDLPDFEFATHLTQEFGVATIPVSSFYQNRKDDKLIRFCFAKKEETLATAVERLSRI
jgi:methionine aminotransferase